MSRCFLSRFLALFNTNNDEAIDDEAFEDVNDDEIINDETSEDESDDETAKTLCNRRTRVRRRDFRLFFCSDLDHCLIQKLETKL